MIFMIATIRKDKNTIIGFRLLDTNTGKTIDKLYQSVLDTLKYEKTPIENLKIGNDIIKGNNGSIERYPILNQQLQLIGKDPLIIISKESDGLYLCADHKGLSGQKTKPSLIEYTAIHGLANGKIVNNHISAIEGEYKQKPKSLETKIREYQAKAALLGIKPFLLKIIDDSVIIKDVQKDIVNCSIPNFVTVIGEGAFNGCELLESIVISNGVTDIGQSAFNWCNSLKSVIIPNSVTNIEDGAFSECSSLKNIVLPNRIPKIETGTFAGCESLKSIIIPNSVTHIEDLAFERCTYLKSIAIPDSVTKIEAYAFNLCESLKNITLSQNLTKIGESAFRGCTSLKNITLPNSITKIEDYTFNDCNSLESITLPNSLIELGEHIFEGCGEQLKIKLPQRFRGLKLGTGCSIELY